MIPSLILFLAAVPFVGSVGALYCYRKVYSNVFVYNIRLGG